MCSPRGVRYWKLPATTTATDGFVCCSSNARSRGPAVQMMSAASHPSPDASVTPRVRADAPDRALASSSAETPAAIFPKNVRWSAATMLAPQSRRPVASMAPPRDGDPHSLPRKIMSTSTASQPSQPTTSPDAALAIRILREGYGPGAWHGPDLRAAISDVSVSSAFRRPAPGRHNIAEIVAHHAFYVRSVIDRLGGTAEAFPLDGEDWFTLDDERAMTWSAIVAMLESLQTTLATHVGRSSQNGKTADEQ